MPPSLKMDCHAYSFNVDWQNLTLKQVDLDLQAVIVDERGYIIDAVYYNNPSGLNGALELVANEETKGALKKKLNSECLGVRIDVMPPNTMMVIIVVAVSNLGHLRDVSGNFNIFQGNTALQHSKLENSRGDVDIVGYMIKRISGKWEFSKAETPASSGSHFLDIIEPDIGDIIRSELSWAPAYQRVAFQMEKGAVAALPKGDDLRRLTICMGAWVHLNKKKIVDLDVSLVYWDVEKKCRGAVDSSNTEMFGARHSGNDVVTKAGGDEAITLDVTMTPDFIQSIFIVLNCKQGTFVDIRKAYVRITTQSAQELARFDIYGGETFDGMLVGQISRSSSGRWGFHAVGEYFHHQARSWKACKAEMLEYLQDAGVEQAAPPDSARSQTKDTKQEMLENEPGKASIPGEIEADASPSDGNTASPETELPASDMLTQHSQGVLQKRNRRSTLCRVGTLFVPPGKVDEEEASSMMTCLTTVRGQISSLHCNDSLEVLPIKEEEEQIGCREMCNHQCGFLHVGGSKI